MKKILNFVAFIVLLSACDEPKPRIGIIDEKDLTPTQIDSILNEYNFVYDDLTFIDSTSQVLFPITTQKSYNKKRYSSATYEIADSPRYWNILFYNNINDKTSLLTKSKVNISNFRCNIKNSGPILKARIVYQIIDTDYNKDKKFNFKDPLHLFVSNIDGSELTRLSPLNENLQTYQIVPNTDKIIFRTIRDIDSDFDFDNKDELIWYQIDLSITNSLKEIVKPTDRKLIEKLYFDQWLVKKQ